MSRMLFVTQRAVVHWTVLCCLAAGCSRNTNSGALQEVRETRGDTVVVTINSGSVWAEATLVEELRIGSLDGPEEYLFGRVDHLTPDNSGGVYVFDGQVPALRHYDSEGNYLGTLGRSGSGPGEYRDVSLGLSLRKDGSLVLRDPRNRRLNLYTQDGAPLEHWPVASGLYTDNAMVVDTADHIYLKILLQPPEPNKLWHIGLLRLDPSGTIIDSIPSPRIFGEPTEVSGSMGAAKRWARSPYGFTVVGVPNTYSFEIRYDDGRVVRVVKTYAPVDRLPEERAELEAWNSWMRKNQEQSLTSTIPPVPLTKPAYSDLLAGNDGRVWVQRHVRAVKVGDAGDTPADRPPARVWIEPAVFDVFEADGTYLGEVSLPERMEIRWLTRHHIWALYKGAMDESYIVRFRLQVAK